MPPANRAALEDPARLAAVRATSLLDTPFEESFDRWTRLASRLLGVPTTLISLVDDHRQFFKSAVGLDEAVLAQREAPLSHTFCQHPASTGTTLVIEDARIDPLVMDNPSMPDSGVVAYVGAPLKNTSGLTVGVLCAIDGQPRRWTGQELATLEALSQSVMNEIDLRTAIDRLAKSEAESQRQAVLLRSIVDQMDSSLVAVDMDEKLLLSNEAARRMRGLHAAGELRLYSEDGKLLDWNQRPLVRALRGESLSNVKLREEIPGRAPRWMRVSANPLLDASGKQIGALAEGRDTTAMHLAQEELRSLNQRLREQSFADELTGLYNRRGFLALATQELKVALRARRPALVFYVDLDGMKPINDKLGHEAGDAALLEAASALRNTFRDSDVPARMGGDEFAVFVVEASEAAAQKLAQRLQDNIAEANREHRRPFKLAMSCGWALFDPERPEPLEGLLTRADASMYEDKRRRKGQRQASP